MKAHDYYPGLKKFKIYPEDIAGMVGLPYVGNIYYVDPTNGSDTANGGKSQNDAFASLTTAYGKTTDNNHDVIVLVPGEVGSGSGTSETATLTWSSDNTHLIGSAAPVQMSHRARIIWSEDSVDPGLIVSGQGNTFRNIQFATYQASNDVLVKVTSNRNYFGNAHFAGIGHATAGDDTSARSLVLDGAEECMFDHCYIGLDTVARSVANAEIELKNGATRNIFEDSTIVSYADNAGHLFVKAASASDIDRFVTFKRCLFHNAVHSGATTMTVAMDLHASLGGTVMLYDSWLLGATDWADDFTNVEVAGGTQATAATAGLMVTAA